MNWKKSSARVTGNWMINFFGVSIVFGGEVIPDIDIVFKAIIWACGIAGISAGYEVRRYGETRRKT